MKSIKTQGIIYLALTLFSVASWAERYVVVMKSKEFFRQAHSQFVSNQTLGRSMQTASVINVDSNAIIEDSLENLNMLVVSVEDAREMEAFAKSSQVALIDKEVFHPAPKPMGGYKLTRPWDFSSAYAVVNKPRTRPGKSGTGANTPWGIFAVKAPEAWASANYGQGARVLVLDTGLDKDHPAIKANFEKGKDFVGDPATPYEFADQEGHGTHVAGTIAATFAADGFVGVAPKAKVLAGRVCSVDGCSNISVAQGINWGIQQKVDVINMSLGGSIATPAERKAVEAAERAGVAVVAASGNDGISTVSFPAAFPTVIAVGAIDKKITKTKFSQWGPELDVVAPGAEVISSVPMGSGRESKASLAINGSPRNINSAAFSGAPEIKTPMSSEMVYVGLGKVDDFKNVNLSGKFALISRGEIPFSEKVQSAIEAGATGVIIFNNEPGLIQGAATQDGTTVTVPVVMIEQTVGNDVKDLIAQGKKVTITVQTEATDYASFAGTSMATPHVTGVVALIKAAKKTMKPAQVLAVLRKTAKPLGPNTDNEYGSGLVDAEEAVKAALAAP